MTDRIALALGLLLLAPGPGLAQDADDGAFLTDMPCGDGSVARVWEVAEGLQLVVDGREMMVLPRVRQGLTGDVLFVGYGLAWGWSQDFQGLLYRLSEGEDPGSATPVVCRSDAFISTPAEPYRWTAICRDGRSLSLEYFTNEGSLAIEGAFLPVFATGGRPAGEEHWQGDGVTLIWRDGARSAELIEDPAGGRRRTTHCQMTPD